MSEGASEVVEPGGVAKPEAEIELREVHGPSAIGGGWSRFVELLLLISVHDFKKSYFGTTLGYLWSLVRPLLLFAVLLAVFTQIFRIGSNVPNYPVLLLFNIVVFSFFQEGTIGAVTSVVAQEGVVRKTQFPRLVIPLAVVLTALFNLALNLIVVFIFMLAYGVDPTWTWLLLPVFIGLLTLLTTAVSMILSCTYVRYRDVSIIWTVLITILFYGTPVLYPLEVVKSETMQKLIMLNPLTPLFEEARTLFVAPGSPSALSAAGPAILAASIAIFIGIVVYAVWIFDREAPRIAEDL